MSIWPQFYIIHFITYTDPDLKMLKSVISPILRKYRTFFTLHVFTSLIITNDYFLSILQIQVVMLNEFITIFIFVTLHTDSMMAFPNFFLFPLEPALIIEVLVKMTHCPFSTKFNYRCHNFHRLCWCLPQCLATVMAIASQ